MMLSLNSIALVLMVSNVVICADRPFPGRPQSPITWPLVEDDQIEVVATGAPVAPDPGGVTDASSESSTDKPPFLSKKVSDALDKAGKAAKILRDMKLDKRGIITALSELTFLVPHLVPIGLLFSTYLRFVPGDEKIDPVQKALSTLNSQLYGIDYKLDDLADKIEDTQIKAAFKSHLAKIMNLEHFHNRTLDVSNSLTQNDFRKACSHSNMLEFINYIRDELSTQQYLPLGKLMINGYDLTKFNNWAATLTRSVIRANFMHINCMSVRQVPEQELNDTLKADLAYIADVTAQMKAFVEENSDNIVNMYYVQAKQEIEQYHKSHQDESDKQFTKNLYQKMHDKYFWRDWIVLSYPVKLANNRGQNNYAFAADNDHVYSKVGQFGRSLYVASTNNHAKWGELNLEVDNCVAKYNRIDWYEHKMSSHWWGYKLGDEASVVLADLKRCLPLHNGLAVVRYADSRDVNNEDADPKKWSYTGVEYAHNGDTTGLVFKIVRSQGREKFEGTNGYWGYKRWTLVYVAPELGHKQTGGQTSVPMIQWLNKPIVQPQITISSLFGNRELNGTDLADRVPVNGTDLADLEVVDGTAKFNPLKFISYDAYRYNATDLITN